MTNKKFHNCSECGTILRKKDLVEVKNIDKTGRFYFYKYKCPKCGTVNYILTPNKKTS